MYEWAQKNVIKVKNHNSRNFIEKHFKFSNPEMLEKYGKL